MLDTFSKIVQPHLKQPYIGLQITLIVYICWISMYVPGSILNFLNLAAIKFLMILAIVYLCSQDIRSAILLSISLVITVNLNTTVRALDYSQRQEAQLETFMGGDSESDSDSDSDSDGQADVDKDSSPKKDKGPTNYDDPLRSDSEDSEDSEDS